ncbi:hypothetical protein VP1G_11522 [Cytospora mali]|uniref:Uncharacterized protein n=1 Tax=Cytospora mali TaxID=578113 RepID=A0A194V0W3_CYTMA|nr:hypothetical protein VP1G_11522 [Valsa mali var. pyri (nom. inval.)]
MSAVKGYLGLILWIRTSASPEGFFRPAGVLGHPAEFESDLREHGERTSRNVEAIDEAPPQRLVVFRHPN